MDAAARKALHTIRCWYYRAVRGWDHCLCSYDVPAVTLAGQCVLCEQAPPCDCPVLAASSAS